MLSIIFPHQHRRVAFDERRGRQREVVVIFHLQRKLREIEVLVLQHVRQLVRQRHPVEVAVEGCVLERVQRPLLRHVKRRDLFVVQPKQHFLQVRALRHETERGQRAAVIPQLLCTVNLAHLLLQDAAQLAPVDDLVRHRLLERQPAQLTRLFLDLFAQIGLLFGLRGAGVGGGFLL